MFCKNCGNILDNNTAFCPNCGNSTTSYSTGASTHNNANTINYASQIINNLYQKECISFYIWIGVVCLQILIGFYLWTSFLVAIWNAIACYRIYKFKQEMLVKPVGIYKHYKDSLTNSIIFIIINVLAGGIIGVVGAIFDLFIRQYAMDNAESLIALENSFLAQATEQQT